MSLEEKLEQRFVCSKCKHRGASSKRIAATGTGISKLLDIQHNKFIALSCGHCGYTELFDPRVLEGERRLGDILDILFER